MKKTLLLFTFILVAYSLAGRQDIRKSSSPELLKQNSAVKMSIAALKIVNTLTENWLVTSVWENNTKTDFTYGTNSQVATKSTWNRTTLAWDLTAKSEYTFNANGKLTLMLNYSRVGAAWNNTSKTEMSYDGNGNLIQYAFWTWNGLAWVGFVKVELTYDGSNNLISDSSFDYNSGTSSWEKTGKTDYIYSGGRNIQDISYTWDKTLPTPAWVYSQKSDYTYDGSGKMTLQIDWIWDDMLPIPDWVYDTKTETGYDGAGNMNLDISYSWDKTLTDWVGTMKMEWVYDANKRETLSTTSMWDAGWIGYTKSETTYTTNQSVTTTYNWNIITSLWDLKARSTDNYSDVTAVEKHTVNGIKVYPNPAKDFIVIETDGGSGAATIQIFDLQGRKVLEQKQSGERQIIPSAGLKKGLYLYRISVNGKVTSGKLVIE